MRLWTIQSLNKFKQFQETGILSSTNKKHIWKSFLKPYGWLISKMNEKIGYPPKGIKYPIWAWYHFNDIHKKPDLRSGGFSKRGDSLVLIEFEIDPAEVMLTCYMDWHMVLTGMPDDYEVEGNIFDLSDKEIFDGTGHQIIIGDNRIIFPWSQIILDANTNKKRVQATVWQVKIEQVKKITHFKAK